MDTIQYGDRKPIDLVYPDNRGRLDQNRDAEGGACNSLLGKRVGEQKGRLVHSEGGGENNLGDSKADSGVGQVSAEGESTDVMQTNLAGFTITTPLENIPISRNPMFFMDRVAVPGALSSIHKPKEVDQCYFVEEPDNPKSTTDLVADGSRTCSPVKNSEEKPASPNPGDVGLFQIFNRILCLKCKHPGDLEIAVSSKKQNLAIEWDGSSPDRVDGNGVPHLPQNQNSSPSGRMAVRGAGKNKVVKSPRRSVRRKVETPRSNAEAELVEHTTHYLQKLSNTAASSSSPTTTATSSTTAAATTSTSASSSTTTGAGASSSYSHPSGSEHCHVMSTDMATINTSATEATATGISRTPDPTHDDIKN
ncbi:hypothetical protein RHMOL_Rhmol05G0274000 [Rhododendron molle]|uniref:Uncharacterized protein n=1 Tax=Rhododendron molle TaxID=49168 RepID=A0ACC0NVC2_RHOML|nr:hypothetical protein RHMOL_Rhmol05G0274000 [Rhododendron molle]